MNNQRAAALVLTCCVFLCAMPFLAEPGSTLPQESQEALDAQNLDAQEENGTTSITTTSYLIVEPNTPQTFIESNDTGWWYHDETGAMIHSGTHTRIPVFFDRTQSGHLSGPLAPTLAEIEAWLKWAK